MRYLIYDLFSQTHKIGSSKVNVIIGTKEINYGYVLVCVYKKYENNFQRNS